ncbi:MAG TPA: hypothetical protein VJC09_02560 [Candidatus Saccharimonadales bacterium]|nr:hypothetical protein [Candidatus Saccharimonadales bacterium]
MSEYGPNHYNNFPERPTALRYSFADPTIDRDDVRVYLPDGMVRAITYPIPNEMQKEVRSKLIKLGLMLGEPSARLSKPDKDTFEVPRSARPLAYESAQTSNGTTSYDDRQLFYELGSVLGNLFTIDKGLVLRAPLGRSIAIVEFAKIEESSLRLVPGVEADIEPMPEDLNAMGYYAERLTEEFGNRFYDGAINLRIGFAEACMNGPR